MAGPVLLPKLEGQGPPAGCPCCCVDGTQSWTLDLNWYLLGLWEAPPTHEQEASLRGLKGVVLRAGGSS